MVGTTRGGPKVVVIGGGLAGITAALELVRRGATVTLIEAKQRLGGRVGSFAAPSGTATEDEAIDYCQHVGMGCCAHLQQLIQELGQTNDWSVHKQLHFFGPTGRYQRLAAWPWVPAPLHLSGWLWKWPQLTLRDRLSVARCLWRMRQLPLDDRTAGILAWQWLQQHGQTENALQHFWSTIVVSALGEELSRVSLAAVAKVLQDGFMRSRDAFHLWVPQRPLGELFGTRAHAHLERLGVYFRMGTAADEIRHISSEELQVETTGGCFSAEAVVLAIPWHQLTRLRYSPELATVAHMAQNAARLQASPITGVHTWWDRAWLEQPHAAIVGRLCQWVFPKPQGAGGHVSAPVSDSADTWLTGIYYQIVISASRDLRGLPPGELRELLQADLVEVFPQVRQARLLACKRVTDPQAVFSVSPEAHACRPATDVHPRLAVAGDWTRTGWPATMEGAIISGLAAAAHVLQATAQPRYAME